MEEVGYVQILDDGVAFGAVVFEEFVLHFDFGVPDLDHGVVVLGGFAIFVIKSLSGFEFVLGLLWSVH